METVFSPLSGEILSWFNSVLNQIQALRWSTFLLSFFCSLFFSFPPSFYPCLSCHAPYWGRFQSSSAFEVEVVHMGLIVWKPGWAMGPRGVYPTEGSMGAISAGVGEKRSLLDISGRCGQWGCWSLPLGKRSQLGTKPSVDLDVALTQLCAAENRWDLR